MIIIVYFQILFQKVVLTQRYFYYNIIFEYFDYLLLIIFLSLLMKYVSKFNFYTHHIVSIIIGSIIIIILAILIIFNINYNDLSIPNLISFATTLILYCLLKSVIYTYYNYLMEQKNISFYIVCFFYGFIEFIIKFPSFLPILKNKNYKSILSSLALLVFFLTFNFIFYRTIYENTVIYGIIFYIYLQYIKTEAYIFYSVFLRIATLISGVLILMCLFIYAEIIELNFVDWIEIQEEIYSKENLRKKKK